MTRREVTTSRAPAAIGPYAQAVVAQGDRLVFCSGQIGLDPATGEIVTGGVESETRRALDNLREVLRGAGGDLGHVVKTTLYLADLGDFAAVNRVYAGYFPSRPPARAAVQVAALPRGARVEIEAIAML